MQTRSLRHFADFVRRAAQIHGSRVFLPRSHPKGGDPITFQHLHDEVRRTAAGLLASGVERGTHVGLISENRSEWLIADLACAWIGAVDVPRGTDTPPAELEFILDHSAARCAFVEDPATAEKLLAHRDRLPGLQTVWTLTGAPPAGASSFDALREAGDELLARDPEAVDRAADQVGRDDLLTIIYTSGTTANPKGVELTHGNLLENIEMVEDVLHFSEQDVALSILPSWHAYERIMDYVLICGGSQLVYSDRRRFKEDIAAIKPTVFVAVPRVWELIHDGLVAHVRKLEGRKRKLLEAVLDNCRKVAAGKAGPWTKLMHALARRTVLPKIVAAASGGNLRIAVSGGGALPAHVDERLVGMGLPLLNGYGLTETSPVVAVRLPERNRVGTIGPPVPRTECSIRDDEGNPLPLGETGLIWIRGPQVMRGYHKNDEATAAVLVEQWFNSGDLGRIERDGEIRITGRAKDTIVLAGGENVEPERIETTLKTSPLIEQVVVVGQDQKNLGALLVPDFECLEHELPRDAWDERDGRLHADALRKLYRAELDRLITSDNGFRPLERIAGFQLVTESLSAENGLLTQTMKVRRHKVAEHFAPVLADLFG